MSALDRPRPAGAPARKVAVGGGKGGVGKSIVAANLASAFARLGQRTVLLDADLGAANQHTLLGVDRPGRGLGGFLDGRVDALEAVQVATRVPGLSLVPGTGALPGSANLGESGRRRVLDALETLDADVLVIDVGAGTSYNVVDFYNVADQRLVVAIPELTSLQNAYAFMKATAHRVMAATATTPRRKSAFAALPPARETDRLVDQLAALDRLDAVYAAAVRRQLATFGARLVGNQVVAPRDRAAIEALSRMARDFLGLEVPVAAWLRFNRKVSDSVNERRPLLERDPDDDLSRAVVRLARDLLAEELAPLRKARAEVAPRPGALDPVAEAALVEDIEALLRGSG